jgi:HD superfamily phosphohydrolase
VTLWDWEREIINHPAYQRLRRIRQLAWTDQVYPGAMHTRFEHSLGVMHVASAMFDRLVQKSKSLLNDDLGFSDDAINNDRRLVRLAALLHDVGHSPFSHASEELFPEHDGDQLEHEEYSAEIIRRKLNDVIDNHVDSQNTGVTAERVASLLEGNTSVGRSLIWRDIITGQLDADRTDYLLRDSLHSGVDYGNFDWRRLIDCLLFVRTGEDATGTRIGLTQGGFHAAEGLVLARYFMFTQVYFHKTRVAFDCHLKGVLKEVLPDGKFPKFQVEGETDHLDEYLKWDDWRVLGLLSKDEGGEHGRRLRERDHYRMVHSTPETPTTEDKKRFEAAKAALGDKVKHEVSLGKAWYKIASDDIPIYSENPEGIVRPLSEHSAAVMGLQKTDKMMLYCLAEEKEEAKQMIKDMEG